MTLDEAIKHAEEVAEEKESEAQDLEYSKLDWKYEANQCSECAKEHRQLADWLKDYKRLLEQQPCEDAISRQAVLETQTKYAEHIGATKFWQMRDDIKALPSVTPQLKIGRWLKGKPECPNCGIDRYQDLDAEIYSEWYPNYCPNCGCKIQEVEE